MLASQQPCCMLRGMSVSRAPHAISRLVVVQAASNQPSSSGRHGTEPSLPKPSRPARSSGQAAAGSSSQLTKDGQPQTKQAPSGTALAMDPVENARRKMGYKNNWHRREVDDSKQFTWGKPLKQDPTVAIIGGGLSGLMCATGLARKGIRCGSLQCQ